uniref:BTB domain-containing protein n=1 Tax=Oryza nivara TaxID=4536 RepID=A0A0E0I2R6_ORYNI
MATAACGESPSRLGSASAIVADTETRYHLLKIGCYSRTKATTPTGSCLSSGQFTVGGHRWRINYYPNGERADSADYISLYLLLDEKATNSSVKAQVKFQISSTDQFIKREDFEKSNDLRDDSFTIRCDVAVIGEIRTEKTTEIPAATAFVTVPPSDLNQQLVDLLETEKGADVVFQVGDETFAAHRCVLAARSPVFSAELYGLMKEGDTAGVVRIEDMETQVFKLLLRFMYTDSLLEMKEEEDVMCQHLLVAADRYNLPRLKLICEDRLCNYIGVDMLSSFSTQACNFVKYIPSSLCSVLSALILHKSIDKLAIKTLSCLPAMSCSAIVTGYHLLKIDGYSLTKFIKTEDFEKSDYLRHDSFTVRCDMVVVRKIRAEKRKTRAHLAETFVSVPPSDMNRQLGDLLETGKGADVVFEVAGERFAAHRSKKNDEGVMCQHLLVAADRYNLERLKLICEEKLCKHISMGTVSNTLLLADQHQCAGLKKACCNFLGSWANLSPVSRGYLSVMEVLVSGCWCLH